MHLYTLYTWKRKVVMHLLLSQLSAIDRELHTAELTFRHDRGRNQVGVILVVPLWPATASESSARQVRTRTDI